MPEQKPSNAAMQKADATAAAVIRRRAAVRRDIYDQLAKPIKKRAFTVAGVESAKALETIKELIAQVPEGEDWATARKSVAEKVAEAWSGDAAEGHDPEALREAATGKAEALLKTHVFEAQAVAAYKERTRFAADFPFVKYQTAGDGAVRPSHEALDGKIFAVDDPFLDNHTPPWDWGCRCTLVPMTEEDAMEQEENIATPDWRKKFKNKYGTEETTYSFHPSELATDEADALAGRSGMARELAAEIMEDGGEE